MTQEPAVPLRVIVGLGNPGEKYARTRHNVGFDVLDALAQRWHIGLSENRKFQGTFGEGMAIANHKIALLKPMTYMNRSGQSVRAVIDWYKFAPESVLVVYDEMALPLGRLRVRPSGSAGGHNGMKSVITHLGTQEFPRVRVGIGSTEQVGDRDKAVVAHVLGKFSPDEKPLVKTAIDWAVEAIETILLKGTEPAMSAFNGRTA
ncbi:aminoacyl-tRNA hydrolase [Oscillatoria sp. CS-180]|uniref:aminoacyl-tRNA hydrolase n=1 Tax=Oscillatoria sp. CS-180 TaxID=3021720 RepID=UPI00232F483D|nr:aminoacyl-tRNA hydrolase [Oscillatoria sp. CS-180]MDB9526868.1 aminoacyl-tRNA hydrolase [Oscillatoria sp. CS-180]